MRVTFAAATVTSMLIAAAAPVHAQTYSIGTNPQGSLAYSTGAAVSKIVIEETGLKMRVAPQGGPVVTIPLVNNGELAFSIANAGAASFAQAGINNFKGRPQKSLRMVASLIPLYSGFFTRKDSAIRTIADLKGKRIPTGFLKQKIVEYTVSASLATAGLTLADVKGVPVPNSVRSVQDFSEGKTDAGFTSINSAAVKQANVSVGGIRVLSLPNTPEAVKAMKAHVAAATIKVVKPGPNFPGVEGPTSVLMLPFLLMSSTKTPDDVVYKVVKAIHGNKKNLVAALGAFRAFDPKEMNLDIGLKVHSGALKFYKEAGI
ncbi:MAG: hypothetical protein A3H32_20125 [Betaproteobacteria bacterium RIFCSPLOWO2_02_FULL_63_19]|nr:MAG: hypothetical protein A3H32_20125 [Betaproteobacteria bacterium RIFCSPLOWO2_02_FULL_63_19]